MKKYGIDYFLGANTPSGFVSLFDELQSPNGTGRCYIIKGGAGTGKSTLMKSVAHELEKRGYKAERIHCSSDPDSLDAVICREMNISIADGTSPHIIEPKYPGAVENIINTGTAWDEKVLFSRRNEIIALTNANSAYHARSVRFLKAAEILISDERKSAENKISKEKIRLYSKRFIKRNSKSHERDGNEMRVFLSAITPKGTVFFKDTVKHFASNIIEIDDPIGLASSVLVEELRRSALESGLDIITAICPLSKNQTAEHIIIPSCDTAFIRHHDAYGDIGAQRKIHASRFCNTAEKSKKGSLSFNLKVANEMINEAVLSLKKAKEIHDKLERIYISAMDFEKSDKIKSETVEKIFL